MAGVLVKWGLKNRQQGIDLGEIFKFRGGNGFFGEMVAQHEFWIVFKHKIGL